MRAGATSEWPNSVASHSPISIPKDNGRELHSGTIEARAPRGTPDVNAAIAQISDGLRVQEASFSVEDVTGERVVLRVSYGLRAAVNTLTGHCWRDVRASA
jgi:hypothetical protein